MTGYVYADGTTNDQRGVIFANNQVGARFDFLGRERQGTTGKPVAAFGAGAGTAPSGLTVTGTDVHGNITLTTGTATVANSVVCTLTFANAFIGTNPPIVNIEPKDAGAAALYYATCSNTVLTIKTVNAPAVSTQISFDYMVIGGA